MKVLVTGGGGFLGRHIVRQLRDEGHRVAAFQRSVHPDLASEGVEVISGSLLDKAVMAEAMQGVDAVVHTAALAGVWGAASAYENANHVGTLNVLWAMEREGVDRLVHCSTPSVVFSGEPFEGADETLPYGRKWLCHYARTKALAERAVLDWGRARGGRVIALRPHLIWGPGDPHLLPRVIERARSGRLRRVGDGHNRVDVTRVENAAAAHVLALAALDRPGAVNRPYFISQGEPVNLWDWVNTVLEAVGVSPVRRSISLQAAYGAGAVSEWVWRLGRLKGMPPMTRFVAVELAKSHWFSIEAARRELGYAPEAYPTQEGITAYAAWFRGEGTD